MHRLTGMMCILCMVFGFTNTMHPTSFVIKGRVASRAYHTSIAGAYVMAISGEEEVLTDTAGNFTLRTWQALPFTLTIQHAAYRTRQVQVDDRLVQPLILLEGR